MKTFFKIILILVAFVASYYFIFWAFGGVLLSVTKNYKVISLLDQIISLAISLGIGFLLWKKLGNIPEKSIQEENPKEKSTLAIVRIFMIPLFIICYYAINLALLPLVPGINEIKFIDVIISFLISLSICFFLWGITKNATEELLNYILIGGIVTGSTGFILGFFGPIFFASNSNQGPLLGIFITGPLGFVLGIFIGAIMGLIKKRIFIQQDNQSINQQEKGFNLPIIIASVLFLIGMILISLGYIINYTAGAKVVLQMTPSVFSQSINTSNKLPIKQEKNLIEGEWYPLDISNNSLGVEIVFSSGNKVLFEYGFLNNFKYKVEGNNLTYIFSKQTRKSNFAQKFEISSDNKVLTITDNNNKTQKLLYGGDLPKGIIGKWVDLGSSGVEEVIYFTDSQDVYSLMRKNFIKGTYKIKDNTIEISGTIKGTWRWSVENNVLTLITNDGKKMGKFIRMSNPYL